jgi:hypothetical protein
MEEIVGEKTSTRDSFNRRIQKLDRDTNGEEEDSHPEMTYETRH